MKLRYIGIIENGRSLYHEILCSRGACCCEVLIYCHHHHHHHYFENIHFFHAQLGLEIWSFSIYPWTLPIQAVNQEFLYHRELILFSDRSANSRTTLLDRSTLHLQPSIPSTSTSSTSAEVRSEPGRPPTTTSPFTRDMLAGLCDGFT